MIQKQKSIHSFINETLEAITRALSIEEEDKILSICSCGAQPLAFLQYLGDFGRILAIDYNLKQIEFAKHIIELIKEGRVDEIDALNITPKDRGYFSNRRRLKAISENIDKLQFRLMNVSKKPNIGKKFTKGYFSNAEVNLMYFHPVFEENSLIYTVFATSNLPNNIDKFLDNRSEAYGCDIRRLYSIDRERTELACKIEAEHPIVYHHSIKNGSINCEWTPCVFRKI